MQWLGIGVVTAALLSGAVPVPVAAQMELGVIKGQVLDETGKPIEGVTIRLVNIDRGREIVITSGKDGRFYRRGLQAVEYEMTVERQGYQPISDTVKLVAGTDRNFDFTLVKTAAGGSKEFQEGVAAFNSGNFAQAAQRFEAAIAQAPAVPALHVNLALAYFRLNRPGDAVASLEKAAALGPEDAAVQYQLGSAYVDRQEYDKAVAALEKGLATNPNLATDPLAVEAASTLGAVYFAQGRTADAEKQFQRVLAARPGAAGATLGLAKIHFSRNDVDGALALFEQVVANHPGTPEAKQAETFIEELRKEPRQGGPR
ncbi:MAG: tetratricopeptide repeat protein [Acidobacteria bacterium]|nr:tetratricopeptide repeat protein [Acidobacteriota bacterium]